MRLTLEAQELNEDYSYSLIGKSVNQLELKLINIQINSLADKYTI